MTREEHAIKAGCNAVYNLLCTYPACECDGLPMIVRAAIAECEKWEPISTAKKGVKILGGYRNGLGNWRTIMAKYYLPGNLFADDSCDDADENGYAPEGWCEESETHEILLPVDFPLTHWRPLPQPPQENGDD